MAEPDSETGKIISYINELWLDITGLEFIVQDILIEKEENADGSGDEFKDTREIRYSNGRSYVVCNNEDVGGFRFYEGVVKGLMYYTLVDRSNQEDKEKDNGNS